MTLTHPVVTRGHPHGVADPDRMAVSPPTPAACPARQTADLIGHWRHARISAGGITDHHLLLNADGSAESWTVTPEQRSPRDRGRWSVDGQRLTLFEADGQTTRAPFTFHEGQLVLPNLTDRRRFWDRIRG